MFCLNYSKTSETQVSDFTSTIQNIEKKASLMDLHSQFYDVSEHKHSINPQRIALKFEEKKGKQVPEGNYSCMKQIYNFRRDFPLLFPISNKST